MTHLSLFSGIGGIDLAAHWAGFTTVALVERDKHCQRVLAKNFPGVPIYDDVVRFDGTAYRGVTLVSGGFPCQPFSSAGRRRGTRDERFLWPEMLRIVREASPRWVLGENVRGLLSIDSGRTFGTVLSDLAGLGYRVGWACYGADEACSAPHRRDRVFIVGYLGDASDERCDGRRAPDQDQCQRTLGTDRIGRGDGAWDQRLRSSGQLADPRLCTGRAEHGIELEERGAGAGEPGARVADAGSPHVSGLEPGSATEVGLADRRGELAHSADSGRRTHVGNDGEGQPDFARRFGDFPPGPGDLDRWAYLLESDLSLAPALSRQEEAELEVRPSLDGLSRRVALKMLGNAVVPQQVYPILKAIADYEEACTG